MDRNQAPPGFVQLDPDLCREEWGDVWLLNEGVGDLIAEAFQVPPARMTIAGAHDWRDRMLALLGGRDA